MTAMTTPLSLTDRVVLLEAHLKLLEARLENLSLGRVPPSEPQQLGEFVTKYPKPGAGASREARALARRSGQ
jgi:hypothetical protein